MSDEEQELRRKAKRLRAKPEFQREIAKLSNQQLLDWSDELMSDAAEANSDFSYLFDIEEEDELVGAAGARADKHLIIVTAVLAELQERQRA